MLKAFCRQGRILLLFTLLTPFFGQDKTDAYNTSQKGKIFASWGGNRAAFTESDIRFSGEGYHFLLSDVKAHDKPKGYHIDYINPGRLTIPQTNAKIGYFFTDKYYVAVGLDHMKYVVTQNQRVRIDGTIDLSRDQYGARFNGLYNNSDRILTKDFLQFEHTDGLNYVFFELGRYQDLSKLLGIQDVDKLAVFLTKGLGAGVIIPRTNTTLLGMERYDEFHLSGYGVSAHVGINLNLFKYFFVQGQLKGGFIDMPDIRTTSSSKDRASQHFFFVQSALSIGGIFRI